MMMNLEPFAQSEWFIPFLTSFLENPSLDPWAAPQTAQQTAPLFGNNSQSFPYGIVMLVALVPITSILCAFNGISPDVVSMGIKSTLLLFDFLCFALIILHLGNYKKYVLQVTILYWFSPLVLGANYWAGQLDIIPITFLFASFFAMRKQLFAWSGILLACAISAKMSMAFALPFILIYFLRNTRMQPFALSFLKPLLIASLFLLCMPLFSDGYHNMVLGTKELARLFDLSFSIGNAHIFITPILLSLILYCAWSLPYLSYNTLTAFMALVTLVLILTTTTPPGWFIWTVPFFILHLVPSSILQRLLGYIFFCTIGISQIIFWDLPTNINITFLPISQTSFFYSLYLSIILAFGFILINGILRNSFYRNETFRFGRKPISIGISGDSGAGKDTLAASLIGLFGKSSTVHISGDDYHLWDRKGALWKLMTHLNPRANDIKRFYGDINAILDRKSIIYRHYQHSNGCFSQPIKLKSKNFCIVSGLHTLLQRALCVRLDVKVFLEMDETLRAFLKCKRDEKERNHSLASVLESIKSRTSDSLRYIVPQQKNADIVFIIAPARESNLTSYDAPIPPLLLTIKLRHALYHEELVRYLIASCGLSVNVTLGEGMEEIILEIEGNMSAEDIETFVSSSIPEMSEVLAVRPTWQPGLQGVMQLVILHQLLQTLKVTR